MVGWGGGAAWAGVTGWVGYGDFAGASRVFFQDETGGNMIED